jgi:hypothetical protein
MDAKYLKDNVNDALTEALTATAVAAPKDKVEYVAKYLIEYVARTKAKTAFMKESTESEESGLREYNEEKNRNTERQTVQTAKIEYDAQLPSFIFQFEQKVQHKQDTMDEATKFIAPFLKIPACYIAIKRTVGEMENLHYFSASTGQEHVVGKKLAKVIEEGDDLPERQGLSFDALKVPEVPEEEPVEVAEGEEPPPPKPAPVPQPLVVDNCMREKRCKFFGIPKLGGYAAVPFSFQSLDHDGGCTVAPPPEPVAADPDAPPAEVPPADEPAQPKFSKNYVRTELIIGIDTIGSYRRISDYDIKVVQEVGNVMLKVFTKIEDALFNKQTAFLEVHETLVPKVSAALAGIAEAEAAALAAVEASLAPPPAAAPADPDNPEANINPETGEPYAPPPEAEPPHELFKPYKDADALVSVWGKVVAGELLTPLYQSLSGHVLPVVPVVSNLLYASLVLTGVPPAAFKDACGDISWEIVRLVSTVLFLLSFFLIGFVRRKC